MSKRTAAGAATSADRSGAARALGAMTVTTVKAKEVSKAEKMLVDATTVSVEDAFEDLYFDPQNNQQAKIIRPPYLPGVLEDLLPNNNALSQCIAAYEVNIDGTGYEIVEKDPAEPVVGKDGKMHEAAEPPELEWIEDFFNEPYPRESFVTIRRGIRRDMEATGNGYMEVLRSLNRELAFVRRVQASTVRLVKKDEPVPVKVKVMRKGKEIEVTVMMRERRFVQIIGKNVTYFKEYGASRDVNRKTGEWGDQGSIPAAERGSEIIHFTALPDTKTGYGVPRWANQIPSVLGSRKAEELNLDFFNAGGLPPALIILSGGSMTEPVRQNLEAYLSGKGASKNRAAIVETTPSGGSLDHAGSVRVTVERFGSERQKDSMFETYDEKSEKRVRSSFRLPPLFVGRTDDYTFASAFASYMVAEAQVFVPEREEFDERMNVTIMKELDPEGKFEFRSLPMSVKNVENQLKAIEILATKGNIGGKELVDAVNEVTNMNIEYNDDMLDTTSTTDGGTPPNGTQPTAQAQATNPQGGTAGAGTPVPEAGTGGPTPAATPSQKAEIDTFELIELSGDFAAFVSGDHDLTKDQVTALKGRVATLSKADRDRFDSYVAMRALAGGFDHDPEGAVDLCSCAAHIVSEDGSQG